MTSKTAVAAKMDPSLGLASTCYKLWVALLLSGVALGLLGAYSALTNGLVVTGLNDIVIWGLWITADTSFIAFSTGAFMLATAIYVLKIKSLKPLGRLAVFVGLIGYTMSMSLLALDLGQPFRFWHTLVYWNTSSFIWLDVLTITFYFTILVIEFLPALAETPAIKRLWPGASGFVKYLYSLMPALAVAGFIFSMAHHASLGAVFSAIRARPFWYRPNLPMLFVISALLAGPALLLFTSLVTEKIIGKKIFKDSLVKSLVTLIGVTFSGFVFMRLWDYIDLFYHEIPLRAEAAALLLQSNTFWFGEILIGMAVPALILLVPALRRQRGCIIVATLAVLIGTFAYRWNVIVPGMIIPPMSPDVRVLVGSYQPTWVEWATTGAAVSFGLLVFTLGAKYLPIFPRGEADDLTYVPIKEVSQLD